MSGIDLDAIKARVEVATTGSWWTGMHDGFSYTVEGPEADSHPVAQRLIRPDAEFIAHARLVAESKVLRGLESSVVPSGDPISEADNA